MIVSLFSQKYYKFSPTILIIDSGIGGLSIYKEINILLPNYNYIYVFDNVGFPYGEKKENFIIERTTNIVNIIVKKYFYQISLVVIACNTASIVSLSILRKYFKFPIVGVVPSIKTASLLTNNGIIGILATRATISSFYIYELFTKFNNKYKIKMLGSNDLVILAEAKFHGKFINWSDIYYIVKPWLINSEIPDTIILGCTHFAFLKNELKKIFPNKIKLIDSTLFIHNQIKILLNKKILKFNITKDFLCNKNIAFCTSLNYQSLKLIPILKTYKFSSLEELSI